MSVAPLWFLLRNHHTSNKNDCNKFCDFNDLVGFSTQQISAWWAEKMCGLAFFTYGARDCRGSVTGRRNPEKCFHVDLFVVIGKFMRHNEFDLNQKAVNEGRNVVLAPASSPAASRSRQEQVDGLKQGREPCHSGWRGHPLTVDRGDRHAYEYAGNEQGICAQ